MSDLYIDAGENELVQIKHTGPESVSSYYSQNVSTKTPIFLPEVSFTEILENDVTARQATLQIALVFE